jgi:hypothetical protein
MSATDIAAEIGIWADDELAQASTISGEDFGHAVTMAPMPTPAGQDAIFWLILVTLRSPLLGADHIGSLGKLQANRPSEAVVRAAVRASVEAVRTAFEQVKQQAFPKSIANGNGTLPAGLRGKAL